MDSKWIAVTLGLGLLGACASKPDPVPVVDAKPPAEVTKPVMVVPEQKEVVIVEQVPQAPTIQPYTGPTPGSLDDFKYTSGEDRVYFAYDSYDLSPSARETLRKQAQWLNQYPTAIVVIGGNADERGTREYNLALGARRAESTKAFLVSQGVAPARVTTVSYGKERPIDPGSNEASWARNRNAHSGVIVGGTS